MAKRRFFASNGWSGTAVLGRFETFWEAHDFARRYTDQIGCSEAHIDWQCAPSKQSAPVTVMNRLEAVAVPGMRVARLGNRRIPADSGNHLTAYPELKSVSWIELPRQSFAPPSISVRLGGIASCDVLLVEGLLSYWSKDLQAELSDHDARPSHLLLDAVTLTEGDSFSTLHKADGLVAPYRAFSASQLVDQLEGLGYRLEKCWRAGETDIEVPFSNCRVELGHGMHFRYVGAG